MIVYRMVGDKVAISGADVDAANVASSIGATEWRSVTKTPQGDHGFWRWTPSGDLILFTPPPPTQAEQEDNRQSAFQSEADPLFFKWQAGGGTEAEWLAKREEIRNRFPYPTDAPN